MTTELKALWNFLLSVIIDEPFIGWNISGHHMLYVVYIHRSMAERLNLVRSDAMGYF